MATLTLTQDKRLKLQCSMLERELAKKISGACYNQELDSWIYLFSKDKIVSFRKYFENLIIADEVLKLEQEANNYENELIKLKNCKDIEKCKDYFPKLKDAELMSHQKVGVEYLLTVGSAMLADEMGNGKSLTSLVVSMMHRDRNNISKAIIVSPATTKFSVWAKEIKKFTDEKYIVIDGSKKEREQQYLEFKNNKDILFLIVNYESLAVDYKKQICCFPKDSICIADESAYIKNKDAERTKALRSFNFKYRIAITGYPIANAVIDLHSQFDFVKPNHLGNFWTFCDKYINYKEIKLGEEKAALRKKRKCLNCGRWSKESGFSYKYICSCKEPKWEEQTFKLFLGYKNFDDLKAKIEPYYIRRLKKDCQNLPDKIYEEREITLSGKLLEAYNEMKNEMKVMVTNMSDTEVEAKAKNILTQMLRLSQLTCGFITDKKIEEPIFFKENPKLDSLDDIVDEVLKSDNKIVIWTRFRAFTFHLLKHYTEGYTKDKEFRQYKCCHLYGGMGAKESADQVKMFQNDPEYKIMISTVQTGGVAIDLFAANTEVFTDLSLLSPYTVEQATDRLHRKGQKKAVVIIRQIAKNTVDERWLKMLESKKATASLIFENDMPTRLKKSDFLDLLK